MWRDHVQGQDEDTESLGGLDWSRRVDVADAVEGYVHGGCDETREAPMRCFFFGHDWKVSPGGRRRACRCCMKREVLFNAVLWMDGNWHDEWIPHTYPLDADPAKDPTVIIVDGHAWKLGDMYSFGKLMAEGKPK